MILDHKNLKLKHMYQNWKNESGLTVVWSQEKNLSLDVLENKSALFWCHTWSSSISNKGSSHRAPSLYLKDYNYYCNVKLFYYALLFLVSTFLM